MLSGCSKKDGVSVHKSPDIITKPAQYRKHDVFPVIPAKLVLAKAGIHNEKLV